MRDEHGFTLIELLVVMGIVAIVGTIVVSIMVNTNQFLADISFNVDRQVSARQALDLMVSQVRRNDIAGRIIVDTSNQRMRIYGDERTKYEEFYFEENSLKTKKTENQQVSISNLCKLDTFTFEKNKLTTAKYYEITFKASYTDARGKVKKLERTIISRTMKS